MLTEIRFSLSPPDTSATVHQGQSNLTFSDIKASGLPHNIMLAALELRRFQGQSNLTISDDQGERPSTSQHVNRLRVKALSTNSISGAPSSHAGKIEH